MMRVGGSSVCGAAVEAENRVKTTMPRMSMRVLVRLDSLLEMKSIRTCTLRMNAKPEHLLAPGDIPVVQIDRGGQVTYHGPGQLVVYPLLDLSRSSLGVRALVVGLEQALEAPLRQHHYLAELLAAEAQ